MKTITLESLKNLQSQLSSMGANEKSLELVDGLMSEVAQEELGGYLRVIQDGIICCSYWKWYGNTSSNKEAVLKMTGRAIELKRQRKFDIRYQGMSIRFAFAELAGLPVHESGGQDNWKAIVSRLVTCDKRGSCSWHEDYADDVAKMIKGELTTTNDDGAEIPATVGMLAGDGLDKVFQSDEADKKAAKRAGKAKLLGWGTSKLDKSPKRIGKMIARWFSELKGDNVDTIRQSLHDECVAWKATYTPTVPQSAPSPKLDTEKKTKKDKITA